VDICLGLGCLPTFDHPIVIARRNDEATASRKAAITGKQMSRLPRYARNDKNDLNNKKIPANLTGIPYI
jgi:hypothetical protein